MTPALQEAFKLHAVILSELLDCDVATQAFGDNSGAIALLTKVRFHEQTMQTRHFGNPLSLCPPFSNHP